MLDWIQQHGDGVLFGSAISAAVAFIIHAIAFGEKVQKAVAWLRMFFGGAHRVIETLERHSEILDSIKSEVTPNHGGSLKDFVVKTYDMAVTADLRAKQVLAISAVGMYNADADGNCTWVNQALADIFGLEQSECLGRGWLSAVVPDQRAAVNAGWLQAIEDDIPYSWEYDVVNKSTGEKFRCKTTAEACRRPGSGKVMFYHGTVERA